MEERANETNNNPTRLLRYPQVGDISSTTSSRSHQEFENYVYTDRIHRKIFCLRVSPSNPNPESKMYTFSRVYYVNGGQTLGEKLLVPQSCDI